MIVSRKCNNLVNASCLYVMRKLKNMHQEPPSHVLQVVSAPARPFWTHKLFLSSHQTSPMLPPILIVETIYQLDRLLDFLLSRRPSIKDGAIGTRTQHVLYSRISIPNAAEQRESTHLVQRSLTSLALSPKPGKVDLQRRGQCDLLPRRIP